MPQAAMPNSSVPGPYMTADHQQAIQYQRYLQTQQAQGGYPMPPQQGMHQQR